MFLRLARMGTVWALIVVTVGAWVRLTDAGLGCPDWPGCYGQLIVPADVTGLGELQAGRPLDTGKAWREMIHRYLASGLGLLCVGLAVLAWRDRKRPEQPVVAPLVLLGLVILQGLLGMWTVTLLLKPVVVVAHLLGGFATLALLFWLGRWPGGPVLRVPGLRRAGTAALVALVGQIALGGWTSANYAALACPDFPTCQTQWWPAVADFGQGFVLWRGLGIDYEGGVLDHPARVAVHFVHRLGAVVAAGLILVFGLRLLRHSRPAGLAMLVALGLQLALGISIVVFGVPLAVAVAHNGVAAVLLLTVVNAKQRIRQY